MKQNNSNLLYHLVAFVTVAIWGTTFVSTKVLMLNGLSPAQIFTLRFSIAYMMMLMVNHKRMFADSWKDEFKMAMLGITGGSLYFLSENEAMNYTTTTNTSLIVCSCPLFAYLAGTSGLSPFFAYQHDTAVGLSACFCRYDYRGAEWQIRAASVACR